MKLYSLYENAQPERAEEMYNMYYGIGMDSEYSLKEIAEKFGVSRERVRQIIEMLKIKKGLSKRPKRPSSQEDSEGWALYMRGFGRHERERARPLKKPELTDIDYVIVELWNNGKSCNEIADEINRQPGLSAGQLTASDVNNRIRSLRYKVMTYGGNIEDILPTTRIKPLEMSPEQQKVFDLYTAGHSSKDIGIEMGLPSGRIDDIIQAINTRRIRHRLQPIRRIKPI